MNYDHNTKLASHLLFEYKKVSGQCSYEDWLLLRLQGFLSHDGPLLASPESARQPCAPLPPIFNAVSCRHTLTSLAVTSALLITDVSRSESQCARSISDEQRDQVFIGKTNGSS